MRKIIYLHSMLLLCMLLFSSVKAQQQQSASDSDTELTFLKEQYRILQEKDEQVVTKYEHIIKELREERKNHQDFVEKTYKWVSVFISVIVVLFGGLLNFFGLSRFKQIKKDVDNIVTEKCTHMIAEVVSGKKDIISKQIEKYDLQAKLRRNNRIIILSENLEEGNGIEEYLKKVDFEVDKAVISAYYNTDGSFKSELKNWDVVIFNDFKGGWSNTDVQRKLVNSNIDKSILFYLGKRIEDENKKFNVSAVNMPSQLYGNLMNLLEYQNAMKG